MSRWWSVIGIVAALALFGVAAAVATVIDEDGGLFVVDEEQENEGEPGLPPFLTGDEDLPPGLADRDQLPPGLAKKLNGNTPPGLDGAEGDLPPGLERKGKIPPGHAKKLGVDPQAGDEDDD